jgi:hypothetical protein
MVIGAAGSTFAHSIRASVTVTSDTVQVQVAFDGEDDLRGKVTVKLLDAEGAVVGQAEPDRQGHCSFPRPQPGRYRIIAQDDGFGHRVERSFDVKQGEETVSAEPNRSRGVMVMIGLGLIGALTLVAYWLAGRKKEGTS